MATITENYCDFCNDVLKDNTNNEEQEFFTARILKRIKKHKLGIIRRSLNVWVSSGWQTQKYDMCPKCFKLLQELCDANSHLPTEHFKRTREVR